MCYLLGADDRNRVAAQEDHAELALDCAVDILFCLFEDSVDVDVKSAQDADIAPAVLELDYYAFTACHIQCV